MIKYREVKIKLPKITNYEESFIKHSEKLSRIDKIYREIKKLIKKDVRIKKNEEIEVIQFKHCLGGKAIEIKLNIMSIIYE